MRKVTRVYGATRALGGVTLTLQGSRVTTLEGGNGAGKSTLLAVLATLTKPTTGEVFYGDLHGDDDRDDIRASIGLVGHESMVYPDLTARESLTLMAKLHDLANVSSTVERAIESMSLGDFADRPARTLSRGQLQRLALARARLHDPCLLLFDEPTTGLDTAATERVERAIRDARTEGRIVVVVTHDHPFAARIADVRVTLERGRVKSIEGPADGREADRADGSTK